MRTKVTYPVGLAATVLLAAWTLFHLELTASHPEAEAALSEPPGEIWLQFSVIPDHDRSSFSLEGPTGSVELGAIMVGEEPEILRAEIVGAMPDGTYTVSWTGAPLDDHPVRGRFTFSVGARRW